MTLSLQGPFREYDYHKKFRCLVIFIPQKYMGKTTDSYIWEVEISAAEILPFEAKTCITGRASKRVIDASFKCHVYGGF